MHTRKIGSLEVSVVGLGCNNFGGRLDADQTTRVVSAALDAGITFFDTADIYGGTKSEEYLGRALGPRRDEVVVATKFGVPVKDGAPGGAGADYVRHAADESLRRLGTDRIDLYQLHFPDAETPIEETLGALGELVAAGKVREIGCSNFTVDMLRAARSAVAEGAPGFVSVQNEFNLIQRSAERDVLPECERTGLAFLPYFPLANGLFTGKYRHGRPLPGGTRLEPSSERGQKILNEDNLKLVGALDELAGQSGHSVLDLAVAWQLSHRPVASVIAGATKPEQVEANAASADWELDAAQLARIDELTGS